MLEASIAGMVSRHLTPNRAVGTYLGLDPAPTVSFEPPRPQGQDQLSQEAGADRG